ncbi:MAG TPA: hypothetical protein VF221_09760 [Chloroflexota bacterium]
MNRHATFREMLARRAELTTMEEGRLQDHLRVCQECLQTAEVYATQDALLAPLAQVRSHAGLRLAVLHSANQLVDVPRRRWWTGARGVALAGVVLSLLLLLGGGLLAGSFRQNSPETVGVLAEKGYHLAAPHESALVSKRAAERVALALFPGQVQRSVLATVRNERTPAFRGQNRLCWIVSVVPPNETDVVPPADPWLDTMSARRGGIAHVQYFLVFVDARTGAFVLASSADAA